MGIITRESFLWDNEVVKSGYYPIEVRFNTLIHSKGDAPFDWYKDLELDKSNASKIRRGLIIPPEWMRIKIAKYFDTDSSTIWKIPEIISAEELNKRDDDGNAQI